MTATISTYRQPSRPSILYPALDSQWSISARDTTFHANMIMTSSDTPSSDTVAVGANGKHNYSPEDDDDDDIALPQIS